MKREIIKIDEDKCNGCELCIPSCPEGALQIIDGKARLVSDLMCDGLGACIGDCPEGAIEIEEREAEPYNEITVIKGIIKQGENVVIAHLKHLKEHGETGFLKEAINYLEQNQNELKFNLNEIKMKVHDQEKTDKKNENVPVEMMHSNNGHSCPGSSMMDFRDDEEESDINSNVSLSSELRQWPLQMHLINPMAPYFQGADVVLAADCISYAIADFHPKYLKGKSLGIACPKLDSGQDIYAEKLVSMIDDAKINTLTVMIMQVPCCGGLAQMAKTATEQATRKIPVKQIVVGIQGEIISEDWI